PVPRRHVGGLATTQGTPPSSTIHPQLSIIAPLHQGNERLSFFRVEIVVLRAMRALEVELHGHACTLWTGCACVRPTESTTQHRTQASRVHEARHPAARIVHATGPRRR